MPADWQLPPGVSRSLWDYFHDPAIARAYDAALAGTPLLSIDIAFVLEHCKPGGRFLDLGCGTGRLALALAQTGHAPVGVDLSLAMLGVLRSKAEAAGMHIPCAVANIVELGCFGDGSFDNAACLFSTLGLIVGVAARLRAVQHAFRLLKPGGVFVLHMHNRWFNVWTAHGRRLLADDLARSMLGRGEPGDYVMPPHQGIGEMRMHLFTRREIAKLLRDAGFEILEIRPVSLSADGQLRRPWLLEGLRAYGYLVAARKR
ncbi:MAG: class I SAM-dependent methyltransferase [Gemmataceae bacterium]|nr:class I SAM-dependent methyltransferase [Gemmataceae bacterium]